jgi:hypothetical protein
MAKWESWMQEGTDYRVYPGGIKRDMNGRLFSGQTLNKVGSVKKEKPDLKIPEWLTAKMKALKTMAEKIELMDQYLLENVNNKVDAERLITKISNKYKPNLSSIQSEIKQETEVTIKIEGFEPVQMINDVTPKKEKIESKDEQ